MAKTTIEGRLTIIKELEKSKTGSFTWQEIVVDDTQNDDYPNPIPVQVSGDLLEEIKGLKVGDDITITCWVNGSYWEAGNRHFSRLKLASIDSVEGVAPSDEPAEKIVAENADDLPF